MISYRPCFEPSVFNLGPETLLREFPKVAKLMYNNEGHSQVMACELCGHDERVSFHHFIPKMLHGKKKYKRQYSKEDLSLGIDLCRMCHRTIHDLATEKELGEQWNTKKKLMEHPQIGKYIRWRREH